MVAQLKLQVLERPARKLTELERKAAEMGLTEAVNWLANTVRQNTPVKSGALKNSVKMILFRIKLSGKVFYDITEVPYALRVMRGVKTDLVIEPTSARALKFRSHGGREAEVFTKRAIIKKSRGLRLMERLRTDPLTVRTLMNFFVNNIHKHMPTSNKQFRISTSAIGLRGRQQTGRKRTVRTTRRRRLGAEQA